MAATTFTAHQESRYRKRWTRPIREKHPMVVELERFHLSKIGDLFYELGEKYGCWVWRELIPRLDCDDTRRVSDVMMHAAKVQVSLLSIFNRITELEGLKLEEERAKSGAS